MPRFLDCLLALFGLALLWPFLIIVLIAIRAGSKGAPLLKQTRIGRYGKPFPFLKLRTMAIDTKHVPTHEAKSAQITSIGRILRRYKIDELPQLVNVALGHMSLVGPRPCLTTQDELIAERKKRGVLALRPGITGLAQVNRIDMSDPKRLAKVDADYLARRSFGFDLRLLFATIKGMGVDMIRETPPT